MRKLWSANKFDDGLARLFEDLTGREAELQSRLNQMVEGLLSGKITLAPRHHPLDDTCCLPLIDDQVIVFRPDNAIEVSKSGREVMLDFSHATRFDFLLIEEEPK
jgi:hypothetical protein